MQHYSCPQCLFTFSTPLCPSCNQFITDDLDAVEGIMEPIEPPREPIRWCTAFGHWGDIFACCGQILRLLELAGQERCSVLYVGPDLGIVDWLRHQRFVDQAIGVWITNADAYPRFWQESVRLGSEPWDWLPLLPPQPEQLPPNGARELPPNGVRELPPWWQITQTHINTHWFQHVPAVLWHGGRLPASARAWAQQAFCEALGQGERVIHLHPVSVWSEAPENHWPYWRRAIEWLLAETPHTYLLTGLQPIPGLPAHPRLVDRIAQAPGNMHALALSELCDGVISTPNNIAIWSVIQRQKALVAGNLATQLLSSYYTRFLRRGERMTYLSLETSFDEFTDAATAWLRSEH